MTADAGREPLRVAPSQVVRLVIGTSPVEPGQSVTVTFDVIRPNRTVDRGFVSVPWDHNEDGRSYWSADIGPFSRGDRVTYWVHGTIGHERHDLPPASFAVGPRIYLGLLWHQHQPCYIDMGRPPQGSVTQPWVRLQSLRAYYAMPALGAELPEVRVVFNLTPVLLWQVEQYLEHGATDRVLELTRKPARRLTPGERETILEQFFDADWHNQVLCYPRYLELFQRRHEQLPFSDQDVRDLQMWYNLVWFAPQFQEGVVTLPTGQQASVQRFMAQEATFSDADIEEMVAEQYKIMAALVPLYRQLQDQGLIEVCTSPFYHPVLPLIYDSNTATIDRPGSCLPPRYHYPEDAEAQVADAVQYYTQRFGRAPRGMWPSEGAVSHEVTPLFIRNGLEWIASDQGVLEKSGHWGYDVGEPEVLCRPYQVLGPGGSVGIFFRDTALSNLISFHYHRAYEDMDQAAQDFTQRVARDFAGRLPGQEDRILTVILDGENTWSAYGPQAPAFLRALYRHLTESPEIEMVTFSEYLHGDPQRQVAEHPVAAQERICELYTGSWIDEARSDPGVDLGTWAGEPDENRAWGLLGDAREALAQAGVTPQSNPRAFASLYAAEGSDWFWWLGTDHPSPNQSDFDALFRQHVSNAYLLAGLKPPRELSRPLVPWSLVWTFTRPVDRVGVKEQLTVRTNCPGIVQWRLVPGGELGEAVLEPVMGVALIAQRYEAILGPFGDGVREVRLRFRCHERLEEEEAPCVLTGERTVRVGQPQEQAAKA